MRLGYISITDMMNWLMKEYRGWPEMQHRLFQMNDIEIRFLYKKLTGGWAYDFYREVKT